jgi:hypothetical protein
LKLEEGFTTLNVTDCPTSSLALDGVMLTLKLPLNACTGAFDVILAEEIGDDGK